MRGIKTLVVVQNYDNIGVDPMAWCWTSLPNDVLLLIWYLAAYSSGHSVYRLMCITTKIYDIRRQYGGITEPRARSALLSHAPRCSTSLDTMLHTTCIDAMRTQAAYNNTSEGSDTSTILLEPSSSLFPIGTKVAKQFDGADGELVWFQ
eukprot:2080-Heterococcus_DN1.PRE.1